MRVLLSAFECYRIAVVHLGDETLLVVLSAVGRDEIHRLGLSRAQRFRDLSAVFVARQSSGCFPMKGTRALSPNGAW